MGRICLKILKSHDSHRKSVNFCRKSWTHNDKGVKRLFTPEIKRLLKDWLVRRRDNPYPSRDEKKILAADTGEEFLNLIFNYIHFIILS